MDALNTLLDFIGNPDNRWLLYGLAAFLLLDAWMLRRISRRTLTIGGNNTGIAVNGAVNGDIHQTQVMEANITGERPPAGPGKARRILDIAASLSGILGFFLAAATFYLEHLK